ncbi:MAG TPA: FAD-dependent thymidylate synthase, partial [Kiritimatiellia bacterium]|nr:FAD-dependent thymidylate synthase [Kiritimatiellia bacterium]
MNTLPMSITAQIVADSISSQGIRLSTLSLKYPRWIHAEFMTHRLFSRNASSSRAVPSKRLSALEREYPLWWGANIPGMQAGAKLSGEQAAKAKAAWDRMADACIEGVAELAALGLHKQWANRPLEWFTSISVLVSATSFDNFFGVRWHPDAQPEIQELARQMFSALHASAPRPLVNLIGRTSLKQLLALLDRADLLICPDSGPAHMATAVGTPVVGLYATS